MLGSLQLLPRSRSSSPQDNPVRSASLLLSLLRPGHQPWAYGCAPWRARVCRVPGGRGLTHLRARAAQWEGRGGGFGGSGRRRAAGLAPPPGARDVRTPLGACAAPECGSAPARTYEVVSPLDFALLLGLAFLAEALPAQAARCFSRTGILKSAVVALA